MERGFGPRQLTINSIDKIDKTYPGSPIFIYRHCYGILITYGGQSFFKHTVGKCFNYIRWAELLSIDGTLSIMMDSGVLGDEFDQNTLTTLKIGML